MCAPSQVEQVQAVDAGGGTPTCAPSHSLPPDEEESGAAAAFCVKNDIKFEQGLRTKYVQAAIAATQGVRATLERVLPKILVAPY